MKKNFTAIDKTGKTCDNNSHTNKRYLRSSNRNGKKWRYDMKKTLHIKRHLFSFLTLLFFTALFLPVKANAADYPASVSVNRSAGECTYSVQGLDPAQTHEMTLHVLRNNSQTAALESTIALTEENCGSGTYTGSFSLESLKDVYDTYTVSFTIGDSVVNAGTCDFSIHADKLSLQISGGTSDPARAVQVVSSEAAGEAAIPGRNKSVSVMAWPEGSDESTAVGISAKTPFTEGGMTITANAAQAGSAYGTWHAKLVLEPSASNPARTLATGTYSVAPTHTSFVVKKTKALEKKKSFALSIEGLKNVYGINKVSFQLFNSKGKKAATIAGTKKKSDGSKFYAEVTMKKLGYVLDQYTAKAVLTDQNGKTYTIDGAASADVRSQGGSLSVTNKSNATCVYKLTNAYIPGNIKKMSFLLYQYKNGKWKKKDSHNVKGTAGKSKVSLKLKNDDTGKYKIQVYGFSTWGKKILLNEKSFKLRKKDMGKNGWYYEKYAGKKYKFYYVNNEKQTDLTDILNLKESSATNKNRFYIEVNRAACTVTIFLYNDETKKYDIPVKTCAVSVGRDTSTNAGTSALNEQSSYTPLGNYSICTNGTSVKYTLKEMHEPDGSIVFARWTSHIVGNVYFHSIAVSTDSHYALPSYRYNLLGSPASAGCIRMTVSDAKWIYDYASTGTPVKIVKGNSSKPGPLGKPAVIKTTSGINYDPTDPAVPDSRKKADYKAKRITGYKTKKGKKVGY